MNEQRLKEIQFRTDRDGNRDLRTHTDPELDEIMSDVQSDRAELQAELADAISALNYIHSMHGRLSGVGWDRLGIRENSDETKP